MPVMHFDKVTLDGAGKVTARGPHGLDPGERLMAICVQIFQDNEYLCYGQSFVDPSRTAQNPAVKDDHWELDTKLAPNRTGSLAPAVAAASAIVDSGGGAMSSYAWWQEVEIVAAP